MSLLLRRRLLVGLAPGAAEYVMSVRQGFRHVVMAEGRVEASAGSAERWHGSLTALGQVLGSVESEGADCSVQLSGQFVRCQLLDWIESIGAEREYLAMARARFRAIHGADADRWEVRLGSLRFGEPVLACAIDAALLEQVSALVSSGGGRLRSVQPHFVAAFDHHRRSCRGKSWWFVLIEPGRLWLGRAAGGVWQQVGGRTLGGDPVAETLLALAQERALSDAPDMEEPVHVVATGLKHEQFQRLRDAGLNLLGSYSARSFDLSLNGVAA